MNLSIAMAAAVASLNHYPRLARAGPTPRTRPPPSRRKRNSLLRALDTHGRRDQMDRRRTHLLGKRPADRRARDVAGQAHPLQRLRRVRGQEARRLYPAAARASARITGECAERMAGRGRRQPGWRKLADAREAQAAANRGLLVVASYHNHHDDKPGHIAIVRPGNKTPEQIAAEGPDVIQAGSVNATSISIKAGFAGHPAAWRDNEIAYYAHEVKL